MLLQTRSRRDGFPSHGPRRSSAVRTEWSKAGEIRFHTGGAPCVDRDATVVVVRSENEIECIVWKFEQVGVNWRLCDSYRNLKSVACKFCM